MIVTSLVVSAVAVLLGILTKLPQGGEGIVSNLMVMSYSLLELPYLHPPPPPKDVIFDVDANIFGTRNVFSHHYAMTSSNTSEDPMPQCYTKSRPPGWTGSPSPKNVRVVAPAFWLPSLSLLFLKLGNIASLIIALYLPWLACTHLRFLVRIQKVNDNALIKTAISGDQWQGIELHNRLLFDLQAALSEQSKALVELEEVTIQVVEESEKTMERVFKMERRMERLKNERDDAFEDLARGREDFKQLGRKKEEEAERMQEEMRRQSKTWEKKEKDWEQMREREERKHKEDKDGCKMGREREKESWKGQVQRLKKEKAEEKERMQIKIKEILKEKKEQEKEEREKERERQQGKKLEVEREEKMQALRIEAQKLEEKDPWETWTNLAREQRIVRLEEENAKWRRKDGIENERAKEEQQEAAARIISRRSGEEQEVEKKYWEEQIMEARKLASKLEGDVLSGRKLIEDLQTDKRIDRQLLIELRAQLMRPTHMAPPTHLSPLHFGGTACAAEVLDAPPNVPAAASTTPPQKSSPAQSQKVTLPSSSSSSSSPKTATAILLSSGGAANSPKQLNYCPSPIVRLPPASMYFSQRPIVRPPSPPPLRRQLAPSRQPKDSAPPPNAPIGPKGWTPNAKKEWY